MKRVIIVQARMASTRLPGKVLQEVAGRPMLAQQLRRLRECTLADEIVVATTVNSCDDPVADLARREGASCFRGSEHDVLARFVGAARQADADLVVRVTADCPLIDPQVADRVIRALIEHAHECDYASNVLQRTFPRGLDVEALFSDTLLRLDRLATSTSGREHVTSFIRSECPHLFLCRSVTDDESNADLRWTVDTYEDLALVRTLYDALGLRERVVQYSEILGYVRAHPELSRINSGVETWEPPH